MDGPGTAAFVRPRRRAALAGAAWQVWFTLTFEIEESDATGDAGHGPRGR